MRKIADVHKAGMYTVISAIIGAIIGAIITGVITIRFNDAHTTESILLELNNIMAIIGIEKSENISELTQKIVDLKTEKDNLTKKNQELTVEVINLQDDNKELDNQITNLTEQIKVIKIDSNKNINISEENKTLKASLEQLQDELSAANSRIAELEPLVAKHTVAPVSSGGIYVADFDHFDKSGTMVKKEDMMDNLGIIRTNVIGSSGSTWKYIYKTNGQYNWVKGTIFVTYEGRDSDVSGYITVYADGQKVDTAEAKHGKDPVEFAMNVDNATEVTIRFSPYSSSSAKKIFISELRFE